MKGRIRVFSKKKKVIAVLAAAAALCILAGFVLFHLFEQPYSFVSPPTFSQGSERLTGVSPEMLNSRSAILVRRSDRTVLFEKNAEEQTVPASLTKLMTVLTVLKQRPDLGQQLVISPSLLQTLRALDASVAWNTPPSTEFTVKDLLYGCVVASGADCCITLAKAVSGTEQAFVEQMNQIAQQIGMAQTQFADCTGLSGQNRTSARDIALLLEYALNGELFRELFTAKEYTSSPLAPYPDGLVIHSRFFSLFDEVGLGGCELLGGKTGFTEEAGLCLAMLGRVNNQDYILVTLGAEEEDEVDPQVADAQTVWTYLAQQVKRPSQPYNANT